MISTLYFATCFSNRSSSSFSSLASMSSWTKAAAVIKADGEAFLTSRQTRETRAKMGLEIRPVPLLRKAMTFSTLGVFTTRHQNHGTLLTMAWL